MNISSISITGPICSLLEWEFGFKGHTHISYLKGTLSNGSSYIIFHSCTLGPGTDFFGYQKRIYLGELMRTLYEFRQYCKKGPL